MTFGFAQNSAELNSINDCIESKVYLQTEVHEKPKRLLCFKTRLKKVKTIDKIIDAESNVLFERVTKSIRHGDVWEIKSFNRIKIEDNKIVEYIFNKNSDYGKVIYFNKCGLKIAEKKIDVNSIIDKFIFK